MSQFQTISSENGLLKNHKIHLNAPSSFIPIEEVIANDSMKDDTIAELFDELYAQDGEVDHIIQIMSFQPKFLKDFLHFHNYLMYSQGALAYDSRHYIALIAAARHKCFFLVKKQETEFKLHNGNADWLKGIDFIPQKIKDLYEINKLLAHRPWLLNHKHIEDILRGQNSWLVAELIMAIAILTQFHALSGFVFGCGINEKFMQIFQHQMQNNAFVALSAYDTENYNLNNNHAYCKDENLKSASSLPNRTIDAQKASKPADDLEEDSNGDNNNNNTKANFNKNNNASSISGNSGVTAIKTNVSTTSTSVVVPVTQATGTTAAAEPAGDTLSTDHRSTTNDFKASKNDSTMGASQAANDYISKFSYDSDYAHQNFKFADQSLKLEHYYTWEHNGYMTGCSLYPEICNLLDQKFKTAFSMAYDTSNVYKGVDASLFRRAVWIYIHSIYGITYDDYDYNHIKLLLKLPLRTFINTICTCPERITKKDYDTFMKEFSHSEKVHLNIVIMEARVQASITYFFRAIAEYYCRFQ